MFDSLDASRNVSLDSGLQLFSGSVSQFDLHDYSTIQLNNRSSLYVSAFGLNADAELNLLNRDGNRIAVSNQSGSSAESIGIILEPGTYYIDVHYMSSGSTSYQMSLSSNPLFANLDDSVDWLTGEFNGDGFKDVLRQEKGNLVNGIDDVQFFLGKSDGSFQAPVQMENMAAMHGNGVNLIAGDFNGDRKTDLIRQEKDSWINGENDVQFLTFQNGNFQVVANAPYMDTLTGNYVNLIAGDFNSDGRTDLIRQEKGAIVNGVNDVQVLLSNGNWDFQLPIQMNNMSIMTGNDVTLVSSGGADLMRLEKGAIVNGDNDVQFYTFNNGNFQGVGNNPTTAFSGVTLPVNGESQNIAIATLTSSDPFASAINRVGGASVVGTSYNQVHIWGDANVQDFTGGAEGRGILMQRNGTNTAYWISGDIWEKYYSVQGPAGSLGYPTSDRYAFNGGWKQDFEGGFITKTAQGVISSSIDVQPIQPISPPSVTPAVNPVPLSIQQQFQDSTQKYPHFLGQAQTGIVNQGNNVWRRNFEKGYLIGSNNRVTLFQYEGSLALAGIDATVWRPPTPPANINQIFQNTALQYANILGAPLTGIKDGSDGFKQQTFTDYILVWEGGNTVEIRPILDITPGWLKAINDQIARDNAIDITPDWLRNASNQPATNSPIIDLTPPGWQNNNQNSSTSNTQNSGGGSFTSVWQQYQSTLGNPTSDVQSAGNATYRLFEGGSIVSSARGIFPLYGAIRQQYLSTGGLNGWLGVPTSAETGLGNGVIKQTFENGYVIWDGSKATAYQSGTLVPFSPATNTSVGSNSGNSGSTPVITGSGSTASQGNNSGSSVSSSVTPISGTESPRVVDGNSTIISHHTDYEELLVSRRPVSLIDLGHVFVAVVKHEYDVILNYNYMSLISSFTKEDHYDIDDIHTYSAWAGGINPANNNRTDLDDVRSILLNGTVSNGASYEMRKAKISDSKASWIDQYGWKETGVPNILASLSGVFPDIPKDRLIGVLCTTQSTRLWKNSVGEDFTFGISLESLDANLNFLPDSLANSIQQKNYLQSTNYVENGHIFV